MNRISGLALTAFVIFLNIGCAATPVALLKRPAYIVDCNNLESRASKSADDKYVVSFVNSRESSLNMYWIDYNGQEVLKGVIPPGETWSQNTYITHPWVARDVSGRCVAAFDSAADVMIDIQ